MKSQIPLNSSSMNQFVTDKQVCFVEKSIKDSETKNWKRERGVGGNEMEGIVCDSRKARTAVD